MESRFLDWLRGRHAAYPQLRLGPGDDAAILRLGDRSECVVTTDLLTEGVDFQTTSDSRRRIGHKALAVNLSDLAAMAATPLAAVISLALPRDGAYELAVELYEGLLPLAAQFQTAIAGGDLNTWDGPLVISVTAIGQTTSHGPLLRSGAKPGDRILVSGSFGGSILGRHLDLEPRVREALLLHANYDLHAGIDCSDGLSLDLSRLAASSNCGAEVDLSMIPIAAAAYELAKQTSGTDALAHALSDGEDFELILAVPPAAAAKIISDQPCTPVRFTDIGQLVAQRGLWQRTESGAVLPLEAKGFLHSETAT